MNHFVGLGEVEKLFQEAARKSLCDLHKPMNVILYHVVMRHDIIFWLKKIIQYLLSLSILIWPVVLFGRWSLSLCWMITVCTCGRFGPIMACLNYLKSDVLLFLVHLGKSDTHTYTDVSIMLENVFQM